MWCPRRRLDRLESRVGQQLPPRQTPRCIAGTNEEAAVGEEPLIGDDHAAGHRLHEQPFCYTFHAFDGFRAVAVISPQNQLIR